MAKKSCVARCDRMLHFACFSASFREDLCDEALGAALPATDPFLLLLAVRFREVGFRGD